MALARLTKQCRVDPVSIKFCDEENANLCALVKHNEALRKGEANVEN